MRNHPKEAFIRDYAKAIRERNAALFVGAGLSRPAGLSDWKQLLREVAEDLGLDVDRESDLIAVAQYHVNYRGGKGKLNQLLIDEFTKDVKLSQNHWLVSNLPLRTIWTTNYDALLEDAYRDSGKRSDVKHSSEQLAVTKPRSDVTIFKMHGDVSRPDEAVLTKDDYETYNERRSLFTEALKGDLVTKTFLFVGFSFTDPNIDYILSRIRVLLGANKREHYCLMKGPDAPAADLEGKEKAEAQADYEYELRKLAHRVDDLKRFGIQTVLISSYDEITHILHELNRRSHDLDVFVSGSASEFGVMPRERMDGLCRLLGKRLIEAGYNLISGFGLGVGGSVLMGAIEAIYRTEDALEERLQLRPFPQVLPEGMIQKDFYTKYRADMIAKAGHCVFIAGNRIKSGTTTTELAPGVQEEFRLARDMGKNLIPIGSTGYVAEEIWGQLEAERRADALFNTLRSIDASDDEIVTAIIALIRQNV